MDMRGVWRERAVPVLTLLCIRYTCHISPRSLHASVCTGPRYLVK
jgi:hypothetical protein